MNSNIILIEMTKFNHDGLKKLSVVYGLDYKMLLHNKNYGVKKLWICNETKVPIAFIMKKSDEILTTLNFDGFLNSLQSVELPTKSKGMTVDKILEKITKWGIESLTPKEIEFLDSESNKD